MKVGYVLKKFPRYSETFILREVLALEEAGVPLQILSLNLPRDGRFHASLSRLAHTVEYPAEGSVKDPARLLALLPGDTDTRTTVTELFWEIADRGRPELFKQLLAGIHVARRARELGLTHLHAHFATSASEVARFASRLTGIPFSFTAHAKDIFTDDVDREGLDLKFRDCRFAVTVCDANHAWLRQRHPSSQSKLLRLYNGIDLQSWTRNGSLDSDRSLRILAVGRFVEKKGFARLIDSLGLLKRSGLGFTARILGDGELLEPLRARVRAQDLHPLVDLPGAVSSEQVHAAMAGASVLVCPCIEAENGDRDALPTVLLEALAAGVPCVATRVGGIPEILDDGRAGILCEPTPAALADAIVEAAENHELRSRPASRGRERAEQLFDVRRNAGILAEHFAGKPPVPSVPESVTVESGR